MLVLGRAFLAAIPLPPMNPPLKPSISHSRASMMLSTTGRIRGWPEASAARKRARLSGSSIAMVFVSFRRCRPRRRES